MKLGIMSDSHGRVTEVRRALAVLDGAGAEVFVHCGDVGGLEVLEELAGRHCWFVWGNMDRPQPTWRTHPRVSELPWPRGQVEITLAGKRIAVCHGHEPGLRHIISCGKYDYVLHGHTHQREDYLVGPTRVVNPGALHRAALHTVAVLDLDNDRLEFLGLDGNTLS